MSLPSVLALGPAAVCLLAWVGASRLLPARTLAGQPPLLAFLTRVAVGSIGVSLGVLALGRIGWLERPVVVLATVVLALVGVPTALHFVRAVPTLRPRSWPAAVFGGALALALGVDLVASTAPATAADALRYHLELPRQWLETGRMSDFYWLWESFSPFGIEALYAQGLALGGDTVAGSLNGILAALAALAVVGLARELGAGSSVAALAGGGLFALQGVVTWSATSSFVELGLTFYAVLAAWHALRYAARTGGRQAASLSGFLAGGAAGTKYLGLAAAAVVLGLLAPCLLRRRAWNDALLTGSLALVAGGPWYLKNLLVTGNPVYPLFFGGERVNDELRGELAALGHAYGVGGSILRLPLLPYDLLAHGGAFDRGEYVGTAIFALAALTLVLARFRPILWTLGGALVFTVLWWALSPQARFLLPALGVLAACGGVAVARLANRGRSGWALVATGAAVIVAVWAVPSVALTRHLLPVVVGAESKQAFVQRLTGTGDALRAIATVTSGPVAFAGYDLTFHFPGRVIQLNRPEFSMAPGHANAERLASYGVRFLVVQEPGEIQEVTPLADCLKLVERFPASIVTSRAHLDRTPIVLALYDVTPCLGPT